MSGPAVRVLASPEDVALEAAQQVAAASTAAVAERGLFHLVLSGGRTPAGLYRLLGSPSFRAALDWTRVHLFWADERCVPPDHGDSNFRLVRDAFLEQVPVPTGQVHRIRGEEGPEAAAIAYELHLRELFPDSVPMFDLVLLGVGADGHTASLFPGEGRQFGPERLVIPVYRPGGHSRVSLTLTALNSARRAIFLAAGAGKARIVADVLRGVKTGTYPAGKVRPTAGSTLWMIDRAAAAELG